MKHSIRIRISIMLIILMTIIIGGCLILNKTFLSKYYLYKQKSTLVDIYSKIDTSYKNKNFSIEYTEEILLNFERIASNKNIYINIWDETARLVFTTLPNNREEQMIRILQNYMFPFGGVFTGEVLTKSDNYVILKVFDSKMNSYYIDLFGTLDNGYITVLRLDFASIQENVDISNELLVYIGIGAVLIGTIAMYLVSRKFTEPILELASIARRMSNLDFEASYEGKTKDEIGTLGISINTLSTKLKNTISELKSANNELMKDIEHKDQIDEMRKDFLSNVSHELKTPIALIQGYAEGLKDNINEDEESKEFYCDVIIDEATKMNKLVKKLLTLNQLEFGQNQVNMERFDIVLLIRNVLNSTDILFKQKNISLIFNDVEPIFVWADEYMIEEVVTNYISNGINHVEAPNIIEVKLKKQVNTVRISVFNTGKAIPDDDIDNLWIKFYKVDKARTREYGGSGIGLSIVKAIMNSHNRECGVLNYTNGVEFWFELDINI